MSDLVAVGEEQASAMWIVGFVFTMVTGGNDTTTGLLGGSLELLTRHPEQRALLRRAVVLWQTGEIDRAVELLEPEVAIPRG